MIGVDGQGAGQIRTLNPNASQPTTAFGGAVGYPSYGWIGVFNGSIQGGNWVARAGMTINSADQGVVWGDVKSFRVANPDQPNTDIVYSCVEAPEAAAYVRGTAHLLNGQGTISLPDHFVRIANPEGMTVQLTPLSSDSRGLAVVAKSLGGIAIKELQGGTGNYDFDWEVKCIRNGYENYQVIRPSAERLLSPLGA